MLTCLSLSIKVVFNSFSSMNYVRFRKELLLLSYSTRPNSNFQTNLIFFMSAKYWMPSDLESNTPLLTTTLTPFAPSFHGCPKSGKFYQSTSNWPSLIPFLVNTHQSRSSLGLCWLLSDQSLLISATSKQECCREWLILGRTPMKLDNSWCKRLNFTPNRLNNIDFNVI